MKRLMLVVGVVALVATACSSSSPVVATVGGVDITRREVESMVRKSDQAITNADFLRFLSVAIQWEAVVQKAAEEFSVSPTKEDIDAKVDELRSEFSPDATLEEYLEQVNASNEGIRMYARQLIIQQAVEEGLQDSYEKPTEEDAAAELEEYRLDWTEVCAAHILVATKEEADEVMTRLGNGEEFADLAEELSIDTGSAVNGGDLGCVAPSQFVPEFGEAAMTAEIGVPTEPVESSFGYHIILLSSRTEATVEDVLTYLESKAKYEAVDAWFLGAVNAADVVVPENVGVWVIDPSPQVLPTN